MNRLRILFGRGAELKYISHLDITRLWHRALRRARVALVYSEGFNPHPRLSLAAPLQLGVTSEAELMDIFTAQPVTAAAFSSRLGRELPPGMFVLRAFSVPLNIPALQAQLSYADYRVHVNLPPGFNLDGVVSRLLACPSLPWRHQRDTGIKSYDLRPLISEIRVASCENELAVLDMKLRCGSQGAGRPEQVVKALGLDNPLSIHRTGLVMDVSHG